MHLPISPKLKWRLYRIYRILMIPLDSIFLLAGKRDEFTPSKGTLFVGGGDFKEIGHGFLKHFIELGKLTPGEKVLDIGCGIGRMAVPLTKHLNSNGSYEGFDIFDEGIKWCQDKITKKFPNFQFKLADIYNGEYNPDGKIKGSDYDFEYENESFDFAFATSVFTHMLPQDLENYISELSRVMKKEGRCLLTFFLLNPESISLIEKKISTLNFITSSKNYSILKKNVPEYTISYKEDFVKDLLIRNGFEITEPIRYGSWCGRNKFLSRQDIVLAIKK